MTISDQFKQAIKAGKLTEALKIAMSQSGELTISTSVASAADTKESKLSLQTRLNFIAGEIENKINSQFIDNQLLLEFHLNQITSVSETIANNVHSWETIFKLMAELQQQSDTNLLLDNSEEVEEIATDSPPDFMSAIVFDDDFMTNKDEIIETDLDFDPNKDTMSSIGEIVSATDSEEELDDDDEEGWNNLPEEFKEVEVVNPSDTYNNWVDGYLDDSKSDSDDEEDTNNNHQNDSENYQ